MSWKGKYSVDELTVLVEGYEELYSWETKGWILVRLFDMWRAYEHLSKEHRQAVLLVGMLGYSTRQASAMLDVSHTTISKRYNRGIENMLNYLNGVRHSKR